MREQIDTLGRAPDKDRCCAGARKSEGSDAFTYRFNAVGGALRELVNTAVDVYRLGSIVAYERIDHAMGF